MPEAHETLQPPSHTPFRANKSTPKKHDADRARQEGESSLEEGEIRLVPNSVKRANRRASLPKRTPAPTSATQNASPSTLASPKQSLSTKTQTSKLKRFFNGSEATNASSEQSKERRRSLPASEASALDELASPHSKLQNVREARSKSVFARNGMLREATRAADVAQTDCEQPAATTPPDHDLWRPAFLSVHTADELRQHSLPSLHDGSASSRPAVQIAVSPTENPSHASAQTKAVETSVLEDDQPDGCTKPSTAAALANSEPAPNGPKSMAGAQTCNDPPRASSDPPDLACPSSAAETTKPAPLPSFLTGANALAMSRPWGAPVTPGSLPLVATEPTSTENATEALAPSPAETTETAAPTTLTKRQRQRNREQKAVQTQREQKAAKARALEAAIAAAVLQERESLQSSLRAIRCLEKLAWTAEELQRMRNLMADQPFWVKSIKATRRKLGWFVRTFKRPTDAP